MIKKYLEFINESKDDIDEDTFLDVVQQFYKILELHEKHYYNDNKIISDPEFKTETNVKFEGLRQGNTISNLMGDDWDTLNNDEKNEIRNKIIMTESFYNIVKDYEIKHYNKTLIAQDDENSFWDVTTHLIEDWDVMEINDYIFGFSENDIYSDIN